MSVVKIKTIHVIDFNSVKNHVRWLSENRVSKHNYRVFPAKAVFIDFSLSRFLKPYHIAPLACLIHEYQIKGFKIQLKNVRLEIKAYLESFGFDKFCDSLKNAEYEIPKDKKVFPLWHISEEKKEFYIVKVQEYFENNHFKGHDLFVLGNSLAELMNNIFDHSSSKIPGYTFTQYNTRSNTIVTCVCDFGIGIPTCVNNYLKNNNIVRLTDQDALGKAFEFKFSSLTKPHNRGFGWDTIFSSLKSLGGKLHVVSNNALYVMLENGKILKETLHTGFPGTLVVITLNTNKLPFKEDYLEDELDFF
ncbi:MAG: hypothetical protein HQ521_05245 [Bacteroidetes bacterium]|nr:hypothetical protein [Bacteroidota bacterium]